MTQEILTLTVTVEAVTQAATEKKIIYINDWHSLQGAKFIIKVPVKASLSLIDNSSDPKNLLRSLT